MSNRTVVAALLTIAACTSLALGFAGHILIYSPWNSPGLRVVNIETGAYVNLSSSGIDRPVFSPDGKKVAYVQNNEICFVNNDGTNVQHSGYTYTTGGLGYNYLTWNTDAIYHNDGRGHIFRYDMTTRTATRIYNDSAIGSMANTPTLGYDQGAWLSADGMKAVMWTYRDTDPFHGANVLLDFNAGWGSYARRFTHIWGHGWLMSRDGQNIVIVSIAGGRAHRYWDVYSFARDSLLYSTPAPPASPTPGEMGTGQVGYVPNANDYVTFGSGTDTSNMHAFMQSWKTGAYTEVPQVWISMVTNKYLIRIGGGWLGALPSPTATTPEISLDKSTLNFVSGGAAQNVTATNIGAGTLTKVSTAVSPAASWLTVTVQGSGGNTQTIANTVNAGGLTDGSYSTTVTVSGGGATNTRQYAVLLTVGTGIAPPNGLTATVGGATARDVSLSWTDNATNETGYSVERNLAGGAWGVIATLGASVTTYADTGRDTGTYNYRVRAVRNTTYSTYSNTAQVVVYGLPSINLTSPTAGQVVIDSVLHIRWTASQITNVQIKYSLNQGSTWTNLNQTGGVNTTNPLWGDFVWHVPAINSDSVLVWVHDYSAPGFGMTSEFFSIHRATGGVRPLAGASAGRQFELRVTSGGGLLMRSLQALRLDVLSLSGARLATLPVAAGGEARWQAPHTGTFLAAVVSSDGSVLLARRVSLAAGGR